MAAEKKRGGNSSPAIFMKLTAALSGVALGVVSCLTMYDPVPVHADFGDFDSSVDYIMGATGEDAEELTESPVAGWILLLYAFQQFYQDTQYDIVSSNGVALKEMSGTYINEQGVEKFATLCLFSQWTNPGSVEAMLPIVYAEDFGLYVTVPARSHCAGIYNSNATPTRYTISCSSNCELHSNSQSYLAGSQTPDSSGMEARPFFTDVDCYLYGTGLTSRFKKYLTNSITSPTLKNSTAVAYELPPSEDLSFANLDTYIQGDFRDYVVEYYPEYIYLLPEPQPDPPQYDTDVVTGIPKEWTITNPQLPTSPHLDLTIPEGDFQAIDPGDTFTGFASGVGFWWSMVNEILTTFHIKTLALALLAVAVAIFALYKIGG